MSCDRSTTADRELVTGAASGDRDCFARIYDLHAAATHRTVLGLGVEQRRAEAVLLEVFLDFWRAAPRMQPGVPIAEQLLALAVLHSRPRAQRESA